MAKGIDILSEREWEASLGPSYREAVRAVTNDLLTRDDVLGIVLAGSIVRGEAGPTSDLDIFAVISSPWRQRRQLLVNEIRVEVFCNPPWTVRSYFAAETKDGTPSTAHMLATGMILYARGDTLTELREEAGRILAQGPPELTEAELVQRCYELIDPAEDAEDVRERDADALAYLLPLLVERAIALLYARARRWRPKPKRLPADLEQFDPDAAALLRGYLREPDLVRRDALTHALVDRAIAPLPRRFFAWESPPEHMPRR